MSTKPNFDLEDILKSTENDIRSSLSKLPKPLQAVFEPMIQRNLRILTRRDRATKIALYGRSGAGKSSLVNAIINERRFEIGVSKPTTLHTQSFRFAKNGWILEFIDSRGVGDGEGDEAIRNAIDYIATQKVDVLLFVIPTKERGYVEEDVKFLSELTKIHEQKHKTSLPVILVLNQIDIIEPATEWDPKYTYNFDLSTENDSKSRTKKAKKERNVRDCMKARIEEYKTLAHHHLAVCACWTDDEDHRYGIETLVEMIFDVIPSEAKLSLAAVATVNSVKKTVARTLIWTSALTAGLTAFIPVPGFGSAAMAAIQFSMISAIARLVQTNTNKVLVVEQFIQNLGIYGTAIGFSGMVNELTKFIPVAGPIVGLPISALAAATIASTTVGLGEAAYQHFVEGTSLSEAKATYEREKNKMKGPFSGAFRHAPNSSVNLNKIGDNYLNSDQ